MTGEVCNDVAVLLIVGAVCAILQRSRQLYPKRCRLPCYVRECRVSHLTALLHWHTPRIVILSARRCLTLNPLPHLPAFRHSGGSATLDCRSILLLVV